ncbi:uncharacterized protein Triagg1_657 [Trichoderma aggressivum f. europaeum]|uniref:Uncharacterized protein n=1 Tax=Trichoderma aggressivum f. europaeum TaxID=173218 RepID=A0AAE1IMF7_9HYPO|nr:hypothetical protein Triagg1_657 [Trichoderma aggressivum f. europaeum]
MRHTSIAGPRLAEQRASYGTVTSSNSGRPGCGAGGASKPWLERDRFGPNAAATQGATRPSAGREVGGTPLVRATRAQAGVAPTAGPAPGQVPAQCRLRQRGDDVPGVARAAGSLATRSAQLAPSARASSTDAVRAFISSFGYGPAQPSTVRGKAQQRSGTSILRASTTATAAAA